jgi:molecular chaperone DnaJ
MKDHYETLGVPRDASDDDIKKAFRKLAHQYHPDKAGGDEKKFKEINEAYQVLSDKAKRAQYDQYGRTFDGSQGYAGGNPFEGFGGFGGNGGPFGGFDFSGGGGDFGDLNDILGAFFGGGARQSAGARKRGADIQIMIKLSLRDAFAGMKREVSFKTFVTCPTCKGVGYDKQAGTEKCDKCKGSGKIREQHSSFLGSFVQVVECDKCGGTGEIPKKPCPTCKGQGRVEDEKTVSIDIRPGVYNGQIIKLASQGEAGIQGHPAGDLYVKIAVAPDPVFAVQGENLIMTKEVPLGDILRGKGLEIESISGKKLHVEIPPRASLQESIIVKGEGMPRSSGFMGGSQKRGDLVIHLEVRTPKKMNAKAKKLADELADELEKGE